MPKITKFELISVDLPFRHAFRHAAVARSVSGSLFLKCSTDTGAIGFGESLPREYVTGESRDGAFKLLKDSILPRLIGMEFPSLTTVRAFLEACDGKAPEGWVASSVPQSAAWCAVDLALLDVFGRAFQEPVRLNGAARWDPRLRYSGVVSADNPGRFTMSLIKLALYGFKQVKLKTNGRNLRQCTRIARRLFGKNGAVRVDANMAWDFSEALDQIWILEQNGIRCVEQPLKPQDLKGLHRLVAETNSEIIADEGFYSRTSLDRLIRRRACAGVNVRISKCGGLIAAARRYEQARSAGLTTQIGCQVGESSLLSAAQLILIGAVPPPKYLEGCYGKHLLRDDPGSPCLQLGYGGRLPQLTDRPGLGVEIDEAMLNCHASKRVIVEEPIGARTKGRSHVPHSQIDSVTHRANYSQNV